MQPKTPKLLEDIRDAAAFICEVTRARTLEDYRSERLLRQAIERNFEIIGEAVNRLVQLDPGTAGRITKHRRIVDFRNLLTHGYDLVDHRIVWSTIEEEVPVLLAEVEALLRRPR
ncbi:MAG: HepT-like ribonuclease domain-containing protein [Burkholderiales bacterium]